MTRKEEVRTALRSQEGFIKQWLPNTYFAWKSKVLFTAKPTKKTGESKGCILLKKEEN